MACPVISTWRHSMFIRLHPCTIVCARMAACKHFNGSPVIFISKTKHVYARIEKFFAEGAEANDVGATTGAVGLTSAGAKGLALMPVTLVTISWGENGITAGMFHNVVLWFSKRLLPTQAKPRILYTLQPATPQQQPISLRPSPSSTLHMKTVSVLFLK